MTNIVPKTTLLLYCCHKYNQMIKKTTALLFICAICVQNLLAQDYYSTEGATVQKTVFLELNGQGLLPSFNYDTRFSKKLGGLGARIGISNFSFLGVSVSTIPVGLNYLKPFGKPGNYLELGGGVTFLGGTFLGFGASTTIGTLNAGYRYQPVGGGFNFRIGITPLFGRNNFMPYWGGMSLGYTIGGIRGSSKQTIPQKPMPMPTPKVPDTVFAKTTDDAYSLDNVYFDQGEAKLLPDSYPQLDKLVAMLQRNPKMKIRVEGHTERIGDENANQKLSEDRANAVRDYLKSKGILGSRVAIKGYGSSRPVAAGNTEDTRRQNRRVTFVVLTD
jgi:outer membrane protein OmpA-like peptidoglycan-associated protein